MHVLVIDDDMRDCQAAAAILQDAGFQAAVADAGRATRACREWGAGVVVCGLSVPGKGGIEVIREIRRDFPGVKVIALSGAGAGGPDVPPLAQQLGAVEVLDKPISPSALLAAIER